MIVKETYIDKFKRILKQAKVVEITVWPMRGGFDVYSRGNCFLFRTKKLDEVDKYIQHLTA